MGFIKALSSLDKDDVSLAGGKGASLGEMIKAGVPVPKGFVVLSTAFDYFLEKTELKVEIDSILHSVDINKIHTVENASEKINNLILDSETPEEINDEIRQSFKELDAPFVAVRSSATSEDSAAAAWAGQLESYLNTTEKSLLENVKRCWASLFTPRAIFYRFHKDLHKDHISVAVIVQEMIESEVAGIAFSVHPVTQDRNQLIIEAGLGLGEAIVSGQITPDSYVVEKEGWLILDKKINIQSKAMIRSASGDNEWKKLPEKEAKKQVLSDKEIIELSKLIVRIENHFTFPVDVEFARDEGRFYIVQSRPITTLEKIPSINHNPIKILERNLAPDKIINWYHDVPNQRIPIYVGYALIESLKEHNVYYKRKVRDLIGSVKGVYSYRACYSEDDIREGAQALLNACLEDYFFLEKTKQIIMQRGDKLLHSTREFEIYKDASLKRLTNLYREVYNHYIKYIAFITIPEISIDFVEKALDKEIKKHFRSQYNKVINLLSTSQESFLKREQKELLKISREKNFNDLLEVHVKKYFWLENNYVDTKYLNKEYFINRLKELKIETEEEIKTEKEIKKEENINEKTEFLDSLKEDKYKKLKILADIIEFLAFVQDTRKKIFMEVSYHINNLLKEIGSRKGFNSEKMFLLKPEEIFNIDKEIISEQELNKRKEHVLFYHHQGNNNIYEGKEANKIETEIVSIDISKEKYTFYGRTAYTGKVTGIVNVLKTIKELSQLKDNEILVTSNTTPDFVPFLNKAKAIITEKGGITSHAVIISREMRIPCIVGVKYITSLLQTGDYVEVDADKGIVKIIKKA
ncbi:MAG: PEP/pyruvate-binding domain-containing protein [Nanoarchaeota archaeon]|nr:PEP/pyruvate-binding domain-containing protein [Nanoarchaeota archaeon]